MQFKGEGGTPYFGDTSTGWFKATLWISNVKLHVFFVTCRSKKRDNPHLLQVAWRREWCS